MSAKKIIAIVVSAIVLVGAFVVYPAVAAPIAKNRVEKGIQSVVAAADVKLEGVTVEVGGTNAFTALINRKAVGDISVRIDRITAKEIAATAAPPQFKPGAEDEAADGVREVLDAIESVGSFELAVNEIVSGDVRIALNYSSFELTEDSYQLLVRVAKQDVDRALKPLGIELDIVADGSTISGKLKLGDKESGAAIEKDFRVVAKPIEGGKTLSIKLNNGGAARIPIDIHGASVIQLSFSTAGDVYEITVGGDYDFEATRAEIEKSLDKFERLGPTAGV